MRGISIISLPPARWREAKGLRLKALTEAPEAFASSYEDELAFDDEVWIGRLDTAHRRDGNTAFFAEIAGGLVGMAGAHWSSKAKLRHVAEVYGVYVSPTARGRGVAAALMTQLLADLRSLGQFEKVKLSVNGELTAAIGLYEKLGFVRVGVARRELKLGERHCDLLYMELFWE